MKTILIIITVLILFGVISRIYQRKKSKEAYQLYLHSLNKLNSICSKFGVAPQKEGLSFARVQSALNDRHKEISNLIGAGELTSFRDKQELNEAYHDGMRLIKESEDLFVTWENISNPV